MFVVRIAIDGRNVDYKVFGEKWSANQRFQAARLLADRDEIHEVALYEVPPSTEPDEAFRLADEKALHPLAHARSSRAAIQRLIELLELD